MDVPHCFGAEPFGLCPALNPIHPPLLQQLLVELLQFQRSELFQRDLADVGLDVVVDVPTVGLVRGWPYFDFCIVFELFIQASAVYLSTLMTARLLVSSVAAFSLALASAGGRLRTFL